MSDSRAHLTNPTRRLPEVSLPPVEGGAPVRLRPGGRLAAVLVFVHGGDCVPCGRYLEQLAERRKSLAEWDGRVLAIQPAEAAAARAVGDSFPVLRDVAGVMETLGAPAPATVVADQWGEVHAVDLAAEHRFIPPDELIEWLRYLAIQCPECQGEAL